MTELAVEPLVRQVAWLLLGAAAVGLVTRWLRIPYAVALVLVGIAAGVITRQQGGTVPRLEPNVVLFAFLPPLLFDAAFRLDEREVRAVFPSILLLAVPGVLVTAGLVGLLVWVSLGLPLIVGLLFGSIVAATDPVAVTAVFRRLDVHHRLGTIVEAESLVNDGTAITLYTALLAAATQTPDTATGIAGAAAHALLVFVWEVVAGAAIGTAAGFLFSHLTATIDDHLVEMALSAALAYGSYLAADSVGASGALACVAAGFVHGSYGRRIGMSQRTRDLLDAMWELLGFLANGLLFLLVGLSERPFLLWASAGAAAAAIGAVALARLVVVELSTRLVPAERSLAGWAGRLVLAWGGLRGALTLALALSLPEDLPGRTLVVTMAAAVVLFTMVVQGGSLPLVIHWTGLARPAGADK